MDFLTPVLGLVNSRRNDLTCSATMKMPYHDHATDAQALRKMLDRKISDLERNIQVDEISTAKNCIECILGLVNKSGKIQGGDDAICSTSLIPTCIRLLDPKYRIDLVGKSLLLLYECHKHSALLTKQMFELGISKALSTVLIHLFKEDMSMQSLDDGIMFLCSIVLNPEGHTPHDFRFSMAKDILPPLMMIADGQNCVTVLSKVYTVMQTIIRCLEANEVVSLMQQHRIDFPFFIIQQTCLIHKQYEQNITVGLEMLSLLYNINPRVFGEQFTRVGALDLCKRMPERFRHCTNQVSKFLASAGSKSKKILTLKNLGRELEFQLSGFNTKQGPSKGDTAVVMKILKEIGRQEEDYMTQATTYELLSSGVVNSLIKYFSLHFYPQFSYKNIESLREMGRGSVLYKKVCNFLEAYYEIYDAASTDVLKDLVQKLQEAFYYLQGSRICFPTSEKEVVLMLAILDRLNFYSPYSRLLTGMLQHNQRNHDVIATVIPQDRFISTVNDGAVMKAVSSKQVNSSWLASAKMTFFLLSLHTKQLCLNHYLKQTTKTDVTLRLGPRELRVSRENLLQSAVVQFQSTYSVNSRRIGILNFVFTGEPAEGRGPTREFFSLVSKEIQDPRSRMWRGDANKGGLFPRPLDANNDRSSKSIIDKFRFLGQFMALALRSEELLDLHLSEAFYKAVSFGHDCLLPHDMFLFDESFASTWFDLKSQVLIQKHKIGNSKCKEPMLYRGVLLEDMYLPYEIPGFPEYKLGTVTQNKKKPGEFVTEHNLKDYLKDVVEGTLHDGICKQIKAFRDGFERVLPIWILSMFHANELDQVFCGDMDGKLWTKETLTTNIVFAFDDQHLSPHDRESYKKQVIEVLEKLNLEERRQFLSFSTGSPRLPSGGLPNLRQTLTVIVTRESEASLPSAFTCINTLFIPQYRSKDTLKSKLLYAVAEGYQHFSFV